MGSRYAGWAAQWRVPLGFALGVAYLVFAQPTPGVWIAGGSIALAGLLLRGWSTGHLAKNQALAESGPYAYTRSPLYLGSLLMGLGFALAGGSAWLGAVFLAFFLAVYWPVMRREEEHLRGTFGDAYERYAKTVPLFFPRLRGESNNLQSFRWELYRKNREYEAALGYLAGMIFLALKFCLR
jgi:protein-S-isoprenylcysteine O-methyltransferase Ste14